MTVLKGLKNNKTPGVDSVVNYFLKIMNMIFEQGKYLVLEGKP